MNTKLMALEALKAFVMHGTCMDADDLQDGRKAIAALEADIAKPVAPYGWQVQGLRDTYKGDHAEQDAKAEAARIGGTAYAFPIYIDPPPSEEPCYCDKNGLGDPSKSCGDCPRKDYK